MTPRPRRSWPRSTTWPTRRPRSWTSRSGWGRAAPTRWGSRARPRSRPRPRARDRRGTGTAATTEAATEATPPAGPATVVIPETTEDDPGRAGRPDRAGRGQGRRPAAARRPPPQRRTTGRGTPRGEREPARRLHRQSRDGQDHGGADHRPAVRQHRPGQPRSSRRGLAGRSRRRLRRPDRAQGPGRRRPLGRWRAVHRRGLLARPGRGRRVRCRGDRDAGQADGGPPRRPGGHRRRLPGRDAPFIDSNPGLRSRFTHYIDFPDYSPAELVQVFEGFAATAKVGLGDGRRGAPRAPVPGRQRHRQLRQRAVRAVGLRAGLREHGQPGGGRRHDRAVRGGRAHGRGPAAR